VTLSAFEAAPKPISLLIAEAVLSATTLAEAPDAILTSIPIQSATAGSAELSSTLYQT